MMLFPIHGRRRDIPMALRVKRARKGIDRAARERPVFNLWFHPINLADEAETMFSGLRAILEHAVTLRDHGEIEVMSMGFVRDLAE